MIYTASSASNFVGSLGVNVHVSWPGWAPYSNTAQVMSSMNYLGLNNMRDYMNSATTGIYNTLANNGFHFDLMYNENDNLSNYITQVHNLEAAHPGSVLSLEGPNEINSMLAQATAIQQNLYTQANADPLLANKPVYAATIAGLDQATYSQLQIAGYADNGNVHIYFNGGMPQFGLSPSNLTWSWDNWLKSGTYDVPGKPVVITETGASNTPTSPNGVDEPTQAKQILDALMDSAKSGVSMTYIYELADMQNLGATDLNSNWGLFNYDWTPKLAATAIHNLTTTLTDGGALTGTPGTLDYTIQGVPQWGGQMLFQEGNGAKDIIVWAEPDIWNEATHTPIAAPNTPITIDLASAANVTIYDPLTGSTQALGTTSHITFNVTDHPVIVEVNGSAGAPTPTPTPAPTPSPTAPAPTSPATGGSASTNASAYLVPAGIQNVTLTGSNQTVTANGLGDTITSNNTGNHLTGGAGADTFLIGRGGDVVTGGAGADDFVFKETPWAGSHITDFTAGSDVIDLTGLLATSGYSGSNPVADGFLKFDSDAGGNARIWANLDHVSPGAGWWVVATLDNVSAGSLQAQGGMIGSAASPPPPPPATGSSVTASAANYVAPAGVTDVTLAGSGQTATANNLGDTIRSNNTLNHLIGGA
ncbi:MAG: hypothetical protein JWO72_2573, partial [Caulobacteraceae bacterium]|nr:hypothetical protein [Caulobacteraceae bacterium]